MVKLLIINYTIFHFSFLHSSSINIYLDNGTDRACIKCPAKCLICNKDACLECNDGSAVDSNGKCSCKSTQYLNSSTNQCIDCNTLCEECAGGLFNNCIKCKVGFELTENSSCKETVEN